jgi:PD-(D/E)XK nuclease superfamily
LSPSSLNLWRASPGLWSARYLAGLKEENAAAWRGHAVEAGLVRLFRGGSIEDARSDAFDLFEANAMGEASEHIQIERNLILSMLDSAAAWKAPAMLAASQLRVEYWFRGVPVPIIGFVDFALADSIDVELKTTKACPSKPRTDHVRQVALYRAARERRGGVLYVTDKRSAFYEIADNDMRLALAIWRMPRFR